MEKQSRIHIVAAKRTAVGSFNGCLSSLKAHELGAVAIEAALNQASIKSEDVSEVFMGQVLAAGQGQNPARQAAFLAGIPYSVPACVVNMLCGSGLRSVVLGYQTLKLDEGRIIVCGGQESMSQAPHACYLRNGVKMGGMSFEDTMIIDGLTDAFYKYHMGITAENVAKEWNVSREEQDVFALTSQQRAELAQKAGHFRNEIAPVKVTLPKSTVVVEEDEYLRHGSSLEKMSKLKPCFMKYDSGTVTAGNSSGINDGGSAVILATEAEIKNQGLKSLATIVGWAQAGVDPAVMGTGPIPAIRKLLQRVGWCVEEVDIWELNEAFAAQSLAVIKVLGLDTTKVNPSGGAIALGHPIGASGNRILVTLVHELEREGKHKGVAALCIGGGMGIAVAVERD